MADTALLRTRLMERIKALEDQLSELRRQLQAVDEVEALDRQLGVTPEEARQSLLRPNRDSTIADVAFYVLRAEMNGEGHGRAILNNMTKFRVLGGAHPMEALASAMGRDERFERVDGQRNYWRLRSA